MHGGCSGNDKRIGTAVPCGMPQQHLPPSWPLCWRTTGTQAFTCADSDCIACVLPCGKTSTADFLLMQEERRGPPETTDAGAVGPALPAAPPRLYLDSLPLVHA